MWLTLGSNKKQRKTDDEEVFKEILDLGKRDGMPQPRGILLTWLV